MSLRNIDIKNGATTLLVIAGIFIVGLLVGKFYFAKTEIKVVDRIIYKTIYKEPIPTEFNQQNFDLLNSWVNSPIQFKDRTEKNYLFITAYDANKSADARYEIGQKGNWRIYGTIAGVAALAGGITVYKLKR
jgi:hypothetical protein